MGFLVGSVVALAVVGLGTYYGVGTGSPEPGRQLVSSGVQSVTICGEHQARAFNLMGIPGTDVGLWEWEKKGGCYVWYHYAEGEE